MRLAVLVALGAPPSAYADEVAAAGAAGVGADEIVATLAVVGSSVGLARTVAAAPAIAAAIGYDLDDALEALDDACRGPAGGASPGG